MSGPANELAVRGAVTGPPTEAIGPLDGPVIVFVHGSRITKSSWRAVTARLADRYRCVCVDLPGHGVLADRPFSLDAAADVVDAAFDAEGADRAAVVGPSLGGGVALAGAARSPPPIPRLLLP